MATSQERVAEDEFLSGSGGKDDEKTPPPPYSGRDVDATDNALINSEFSDSMDENSEVGCCHPSRATHRYFVLIFMCLLAFGSYYCYDNPAALQEQILHDMNITLTAYTNFYSWYSYPNVILCFFGGFLLDTLFGIRLGAIIFAALICVGQMIFAAGAFMDNFYLMVFGRFFFGLGGESLAVAQNTYSVLWFKGKELNTVFGFQLSIARLGSMVNFNTMPYVYNYVQHYVSGHTGLAIVLTLAGLVCVLSLLCALILAYFDKRAERLLRREILAPGERINLKDVLHFPLQFWLLCSICVLYYVAIFPFISVAGTFLHEKYNMTKEEAAFISSIPYTVSAIVSPLCGILCDVTGLNLIWTIVATIISAACHVAFSFGPPSMFPPGIIMAVLGFGFSLLACAFWPMVALLIPEHQLGTAYGVMQAAQNAGLALVVQATGAIHDNFGYQWVEVYFLIWMFASLGAAVILQIQNMSTNGILNPPQYRKNLCRRSDDPDQEALVHQD